MMDYQDYYKILNVDRKASKDEIKRAYRKLAMKYHPDQNQGDASAEEKFKQINEAYQVLSDDDKRAHFDRLGSAYKDWQQHGGQGGFNWNQWAGRGPEGVRVEYNGDLGDMFGGGFSDFFQSIFGSMGGFGSMRSDPRQSQFNRAQAQRPYETELVISLHEAYNGSTRQIKINEIKYDVKIPVGSKTGTKVRMRGAGPNKTDVHLIIKVAPDPRFEIRNDRLHTFVDIDLPTAVLGGEVTVPTLSGNIILSIPPGTQPSQTFRLKGKGMPKLNDKSNLGALFVNIQVKIPQELTPEQKDLFEKLAKLK
jgi:curved DNA-binding protein